MGLIPNPDLGVGQIFWYALTFGLGAIYMKLRK